MYHLQISPSCQTLSKAVDISKKADLTSSGDVASKDWKIFCAIERKIIGLYMNLMDGNQIDLDLRVVRFEGKCTFY